MKRPAHTIGLLSAVRVRTPNMSNRKISRLLVAEFIGTAMLLMAVVGSGIMAERLAGSNIALALLANTIATGAALFALILMLGPVSGSHMNPFVSLSAAIGGELSWTDTGLYSIAQVAGA